MSENVYFWNKNVKVTSALEAPLPNPQALPPDPHVITPTYYCKFVKFISSTKCGSLPPQKRTK